MADMTIPLKQCSRKSACIHPEQLKDGWLPETSEYFAKAKRYKNGFASWCRYCRRQYERMRQATPEDRARQKARRQSPENKQRQHDYYRSEKYREYEAHRKQTPRRVEWIKLYRASPEYKSRQTSARYKGFRRRWRLTPNGRAQTNEGARRFRHNHPEYAQINNQRRRSHRYGLPDTFTDVDWQRALDYFGGVCAVCGRPAGLWHTLAKEHWIALTDPRLDNPGTVPTNIVPMCHSLQGGENGCNNLKSNKEPALWLLERYGKRKAKAIAERIQVYFQRISQQTEQ